MKRVKGIIALATLSLVTLGSVVTSTLAWFKTSVKISLGEDNESAKVLAGAELAYYGGGDGSYESPNIISSRIHLYNLAWLQYIGRYNSPSIDQQYFIVTNNIDMEGMVLPPIGTDEYPFLGNFNGGGYTISNFTIVNDDPRNVNSEYGMAKPSGVNFTENEIPKIVGFFGVVGELPDEELTYTSSIVEVKNITLKDFTVKTKSSQTLIGLAAGYVNVDESKMSGVKIDGNATINANNQASTAISSITSNLSDYGLVGFTNRIGRNGSFSKELSEYYNNGADDGSGGQGNNFGDSIDMLSLYNRLKKVYNSDSYDNGSFTITTTTSPSGVVTKQKTENLSNHYSGYYTNDHSYTFNKHSSGSQDFYYLYGDYSPVSGTVTENSYVEASQSVTSNKLRISQSTEGYVIKAGSYYVKMPTLTSLNNTTNVTAVTSESEATIFSRVANSTGYRYYIYQSVKGNNAQVFFGTLGGTGEGVTLKAIAYNPNTTNNKKYTTFYTDGSGTYHYRYNASDTTKKCYICYYSNAFYSYNKNNGTTGTTGNATPVSTTYYLRGTTDGVCSATSIEANASVWYFEDGYIFTIYDNRMYFLYFTGSKLAVAHLMSKSNATTFTYSGGALTFTSSSTYYLNLAASSLVSTSSVTNTVMTNLGASSLADQTYVTSSSTNTPSIPYSSFKDTYIPLSVSSSDIYSTASRNTGYIISGKSYINPNFDSNGEANYYNSGDVRVSRYDMSNINAALGQSSYDDSKMYVITATSNSDYALITDSHNNGNNAPNGLSSISGRKAATALNRYNDWEDTGGNEHNGARDSIGDTFTSDSANIYGLHFMNATVSSSNVVTVPSAKINNETYTSGLTMPRDCIDFFVKEAGYITFFAGTYFSSNNCFFSLHKIERNSDNSIKSITQINTIYKDSANNYYYNPVDTTNKTKVFDTAVLTSPTTFINNAVYYFEIPVGGDSEFALGSVSGDGKNGAYLMYLDISASGEEIEQDSVTAFHITTKTAGSDFPAGVDFAPVSVSGNGGESIGVYIESGKQGTITFAVSSSTIGISQTVTNSTPISTYAFQGTKYDTSGGFTVTGTSPGALVGPPSGGIRVLTINLTTINDVSHVITITDTFDVDDGHGGFTYDPTASTYQIDNNTPVVGSNAAIKVLSSELDTDAEIDALRNLNKAATLSRQAGFTNEFDVTYDVVNCNYTGKKIDVDVVTNGSTIIITVENGYEFYIGGVRKYTDDTYSA